MTAPIYTPQLAYRQIGALVGGGLHGDRVFDTHDRGNRDNIHAPFIALQEALRRYGLDLHTPDVLARQGLRPDFEIHLNARRRVPHPRSYALLFETPHIRPLNAKLAHLARYRKVFTWRPEWVDGQRFVPLAFPNPIALPEVDGLAGRDRMVCMIAGNKTMTHDDGRGLYTERLRTIKWFEQHQSQAFDLYGPGWGQPARRSTWSGRAARAWQTLLLRWHGQAAFPNWRGLAASKLEVMRRTRFAICYENVRDFPGYITEKIFDCLFAGCVPIYWGPQNIAEHVPAACFIDRRAYASHEALFDALCAISESEYRARQQAMYEFLASEQAQVYSAIYFGDQVAAVIRNDMN